MDAHSRNLGETLASHIGERSMQLLLDYYAQEPQGLDAILEDNVEQEAVLDYITDLEIRREIFLEFQAMVRRFEPSTALSGIALGIIMVAPIDQLRIHLDEAKIWSECDNKLSIYGLLHALRGAAAVNGIRAFVVKGGRHANSSASSVSTAPIRPPGVTAATPPGPFMETMGHEAGSIATPTITRKVEAANMAKERDGWKCIISGMEDPEAAHIFPFSTTEKRNFYDLSSMLQIFWGEEQAQRWAELFEGTDLIESAANLICLNHQLHWWFDNAKMALKPLRVTEEGAVVVQFHWLRRNNLKPQSPLEMPSQSLEFADILAKAGLSDNRAWGNGFAHRRSGRPLRTGQTFTLGAKDPKRAPSFELLQLSWDLLRVAAISGAALPGSLTDEDDEDWSEYEWCGNVEAPETAAEARHMYPG